ncbi:hypothetical protein ACTFIR_007481 [Dictyostelium discoideum]
MDQNEPIINNENSNLDTEKSKKKLNETEIEFFMLGIDNSISLKLLEKFKSFIDQNKNNLNQIRYSPQYMDKLFMENFQIKGETFLNQNYDHSIFYFEIKKVLDILLNKKHFFERIDFDTDFETGIYTNYKSGLQFKNLRNKNKNKIVLLRIFIDSIQCQNKKDYTIMLDIENYTGNEFKNNKLLLCVVPNDWLHNFHQTIRALFSSFIGNGFKVIIENEQIDVVPFGLTMDIPEFRSSCKLNGHNSNECACHTCDKPRDVLFICQSGTLRKQEDITNFHSTKPTYAELNDDIELKKVWEKKAKDIGIKGVDRGWVEPLSINYLITQPDILHNILLGVAQRCLNYIFDKYKNKIANFLNNLKNAKIIDNRPKPSTSLFTNKTRKGRENRSILYYLLISIKNQISNDDFLIMEQLETICFTLSHLYKKLGDEQYERVTKLNMVKFINSVDKLKSIEPESTALIIGNKIKNPDNLDHRGENQYLKAPLNPTPKFTSAERFEAQFSKIKDLLTNNTNNQDKHKFERVTKILMATFLDNFNNLKKKEDDNNDLILGQKIKKDENIKFKNNIISDINLHYKNIENIQFHKSIKNSKEIYNVGDGIEVASENSVTGRWSAIIIAICLIELNNNKSVHSIYIQYFDKDKGDQNNNAMTNFQ